MFIRYGPGGCCWFSGKVVVVPEEGFLRALSFLVNKWTKGNPCAKAYMER